MAKIKNMGTATARFKEGLIVTGSAGTDEHTLVVTGSASILGDITCNNISIGANASGTGRTISAGNTDTSLRFNSADGVDIVVGGAFFISCDENASQDTIVFNTSGHDIDFRVESDNKTHQIFSDAGNDLLVLGSDVDIPGGVGSDTNIIISGSQDGQGNVVFTGDIVVSGSLYFTQKYVHTVKFTHTSDATKKYVRWESNGVNSAPGVNNKWVAPADGRLSQVVIRSTHTPGNTTLGFHRVSDGTENFSSSAVETQSVDLSTANTSAVVGFSSNASFSQGEVVGFSMHPTSAHGNVNISFIFELDFTS